MIAKETDSAKLVIKISDVNDNAPVFNPSSYSSTIQENLIDITVLDTVVASDSDQILGTSDGQGGFILTIANGQVGHYLDG